MHFYPSERVALLIDGANLYATSKALAFDIDYKRLLTLFRQKAQLVRALYYTAIAEEQEYSSIRPLIARSWPSALTAIAASITRSPSV